ncbi:MAG: SAM-dependent methyltransferase, partial [Longimicrobiales bacterium]
MRADGREGRGEEGGESALFVVSTPIGNLSDVSRRARDVLERVDLVLAEDTRRTRILMDHLGLSAPLRSLHAHNEASRIDEVLEMLEGGRNLGLVSDSGTPLVSDPGERLVAAVTEAGHRVVPVPGPSA